VKFKVEELKFLVSGEGWVKKVIIGSVLGFFGSLLFIPIIWVLGYGIRVLKSAMAGEELSLPAWDNGSELFKDGLRFIWIGLVYSVPILLVVIPISFLMFLATLNGDEQSPVFIIAVICLSLGMFPLIFYGFLMQFGLPVALIRSYEMERVGAAFQFGEVFRMLKENIVAYLVAFGIAYGLAMIASYVMLFASVTIILIPVAFGLYAFYYYVLTFAMYGKAYYQGQQKQQGESASA